MQKLQQPGKASDTMSRKIEIRASKLGKGRMIANSLAELPDDCIAAAITRIEEMIHLKR